MKRVCFYAMTMAAVLLFSSCPTQTEIPLVAKGQVLVDKNLVGRWKADNAKSDIESFYLSVLDDYTYTLSATLVGDVDMSTYTQDFIAWLVKIDTYNFIVIQDNDKNVRKQKYYLYAYRFENEKLVIAEVVNMNSVLGDIKTPDDYKRELITASRDAANFLGNELSFSKVNTINPLNSSSK